MHLCPYCDEYFETKIEPFHEFVERYGRYLSGEVGWHELHPKYSLFTMSLTCHQCRVTGRNKVETRELPVARVVVR